MKVFVLLSMVVAALAVPNNYGKVEKTEIRIEAPAPVRSSYEAPVRSSYEAPVRSYEAPVVKQTYSAPVRTYEAPVVKQTFTYSTPAPVRSSYEAPVRTSYEAPAAYGSYGETLTKEVVRPHIPIVQFNHETDHKGTYALDIKTGHGISHSEKGSLRDLKSIEGPVNIKSGSYSYTGPDKVVYTVHYTADEHGFRATGDHIPTPPPIPEEIKKSLALPRIKEFQPEFEHLHHHEAVQSELPVVRENSYGSSYSSYSQPSLPVRSHY